MEIRFDGKKALVTGAGKGIGRGVALALWAGGADTYALSRTQADLESLATECPGIHTICLDLCQFKETRETIEKIGAFDLLVNNAGVISRSPALEASLDEFDRLMNTNVKAVLNVTQAVAKDMVARKCRGAIVNVSSRSSKRVVPDTVLYAASKGALDQITRSLAIELGPHGIRVNSVNPTLTLGTQMSQGRSEDPVMKSLLSKIPMNEFCKTEDVVNAILYQLSDKAHMINGAFFMIDGGLSCT